MTFAEKLNSLVTLTGTTNAKISRGISIDASMVSKWRKGVRNPVNNMETVLALSDYFATRITVEYQRNALAKLIERPVPNIQNKANIRDSIYAWFTEGTLELLAPPREEPNGQLAGVRRRQPASLSQVDYKYTGQKGRERVLKAFGEQLEAREQKISLLIYYDEPQEWAAITGDYLERLSQTLPGSFRQVEKLQVLVPTEVQQDEMEGLLRLCIPFVGAATVMVYHIPRIRGMFQHLMMAARDFMALTSLGTYGSPYTSTIMHSDPGYVNHIVDDLSAQLPLARPLLEYQHAMGIANLFGFVGAMFGVRQDIISAGHMLPPVMMPKPLLEGLLDRLEEFAGDGGATGTQQLYKGFEAFLEHNRFYQYMPLLLPEEVAGGMVELPTLPGVWGGQAIVTPQAYLEVLKNIQALCERHRNFLFAPGAFQSFSASITIQNNNAVAAVQNTPTPQCYTSESANVGNVFYHTVWEWLREDFRPEKQAENRAVLAGHIQLYEEQLKKAE